MRAVQESTATFRSAITTLLRSPATYATFVVAVVGPWVLMPLLYASLLTLRVAPNGWILWVLLALVSVVTILNLVMLLRSSIRSARARRAARVSGATSITHRSASLWYVPIQLISVLLLIPPIAALVLWNSQRSMPDIISVQGHVRRMTETESLQAVLHAVRARGIFTRLED